MEDEKYSLSLGACMLIILDEYGIKAPSRKICEYMAEDLMKLLVKQGLVDVRE